MLPLSVSADAHHAEGFLRAAPHAPAIVIGVEPRVGHAAALANPHWQETLRWSARKVVPFLREQGIIGGPSEFLWRKAHLV